MKNLRNNRMLKDMLGIEHAVIQAPMAGGITTPELVGGVSEAGGLGMIAGGGLEAEDLKEAIQKTRRVTGKPFGVNLFIPRAFEVTTDHIDQAYRALKPVYDQMDLEQKAILPPDIEDVENKFNRQLEVIIEERVPVCSFIFGIPAPVHIEKLKEAGIIIMGTATTPKEAEALEQAGFDAVVMQGGEAGGHRGSFLEPVEDSVIGLMSLIPETVDRVSLPVVASGGIMDGRGIAAVRVLGAAGVLLGTAFLSTKESGAHTVHKKALTESRDKPSILTKVFTGRAARAVKNTFIKDMTKHTEDMVDYPVQRSLTQPIQDRSKQEGNPEYAMLLAGQGKVLARDISAGELVGQLVSETTEHGFEI